MHVVGDITLSINIKHQQIKHKFPVVRNLPYNFLIGRDILSTCNATKREFKQLVEAITRIQDNQIHSTNSSIPPDSQLSAEPPEQFLTAIMLLKRKLAFDMRQRTEVGRKLAKSEEEVIGDTANSATDSTVDNELSNRRNSTLSCVDSTVKFMRRGASGPARDGEFLVCTDQHKPVELNDATIYQPVVQTSYSHCVATLHNAPVKNEQTIGSRVQFSVNVTVAEASRRKNNEDNSVTSMHSGLNHDAKLRSWNNLPRSKTWNSFVSNTQKELQRMNLNLKKEDDEELENCAITQSIQNDSNIELAQAQTMIRDMCAEILINKLCELTQSTTTEHLIQVNDETPIRQKPRKIPYYKQKELREMLNDMLEAGIIQKSSSAWRSPIKLVGKSDGSLRITIDFRKLNEVTKKDAYSVPDIWNLIN